jgi:hypothetical protein
VGRRDRRHQARPVPFSSVSYPTDYGYFPHTLAEDEDPLDAMVCVSEATFSGCYIPVNVIAVFRMRDEKGVDDKLLCSRTRIRTGRFVAAVGVMLGAAIRYVGLALRDDPVSASVLSRDGLIGGVTSGISSMSAGESAAKRRHHDDEP